MTIDELLTMAQQYVRRMADDDAAGMKWDGISILAQMAQACAQTAQAMILEQSTASIANNKGRVLMVDTGN